MNKLRIVLFYAVAVALLSTAIGGCGPQGGGGPPAHPNPVIVREFAFTPGIITLDPSFGFSLYRGSPGVPPRQRAESVGRAAAFNVADSAAQQLVSLGYDAIRSDTAGPEPGARALIVTGAFREINEGYRRHIGADTSTLVVDVEIAFQGGGAAPQRITALHLDSRRIPRSEIVAAAINRNPGINSAAARIGGVIAHYVADLARLNKWPVAAR
jgi:hypothetical protein